MTAPTMTLPLPAAVEDEVVGELLRILIECLEQQMGTKSRMFFLRKFFSELDKEIPLEKFIAKRLTNSHVEEAISDLIQTSHHVNFDRVSVQRDLRMNSTSSRSLREPGEEELLQKLERFKIRTVILGGGVVVKKHA